MALRFNRGQQATRSSSISSARATADPNNSLASSSAGTNTSMRFVQKYLDECRSFYSCIYCRTHLANHDELISRSFQGNRSRAYLFNSVINVSCGPSVQRELNTGSHSVADIFCTNCGTTIGWKYEKAFVDSQRYKEGKYIIELAHVVRENRHLELDKRDIFLGLATAPPKQSTTTTSSSSSTPGAATIGTSHHQGSLSPTSSAGQWSPGTSSSSSSSSSSNDDATTLPSCRYASSNQATSPNDQRQRRFVDDEDDDDDIEDDEVLMFPFYDDLYGNRSSYSNLSTSRSYQKKLRRSLHLDAAPYNWKFDHAGGTSSSTSMSPTATKASTSLQQQHNHPLQQLQSGSFAKISSCLSESIEIPASQIVQAKSDSTSRHQLAANRRFFASTSSSGALTLSQEPLQTFPPQPTTSSTLSMSGKCEIDNNSEQLATSKASSFSPSDETNSINHDNDNDNDGDTQFRFEHDKQAAVATDELSSRDRASGSQNYIQPIRDSAQLKPNPIHLDRQTAGVESTPGVNLERLAISKQSSVISMDAQLSQEENGACETLAIDNSEVSSSSLSAQSIPRTNSLSFDDEEFYDCNTDHDVSNSSVRTK